MTFSLSISLHGNIAFNQGGDITLVMGGYENHMLAIKIQFINLSKELEFGS